MERARVLFVLFVFIALVAFGAYVLMPGISLIQKAYADQRPLIVETEDDATSATRVYKIKVQNGSLNKESDGIVTIGAGGTGNFSTLTADTVTANVIGQSADVDLYVDTATGNDTFSGTEEAPFATIQKAIDSLPNIDIGQHNTVIYIAPGVYEENVDITGTLNTSLYVYGTGDNPEDVIIRGTTPWQSSAKTLLMVMAGLSFQGTANDHPTVVFAGDTSVQMNNFKVGAYDNATEVTGIQIGYGTRVGISEGSDLELGANTCAIGVQSSGDLSYFYNLDNSSFGDIFKGDDTLVLTPDGAGKDPVFDIITANTANVTGTLKVASINLNGTELGILTGANQTDAGAGAGELWCDNSNSNVIKLGI